ncbi:MAG: thymidine kinase [Bacteroidales bacterium]|nr:thymidine kinase [Bacteroidales bacterium]
MQGEYLHKNYSRGRVEVITGPMFSGKTEELIRRLKRAVIANQKVKAFKHRLDNRYSEEYITSHDEKLIESIQVGSAQEILNYIADIGVVGIDEAQFFHDDLIEICRDLANKGIRVIVAGLDMDYRGEPFNPIPTLMACAEEVLKLQAICIQCGNPASFSHKKVFSDNKVMVGASKEYEPLCRQCFNKVVFD